MANKKDFSETTEFKIKRKKKKGLAIWQKILVFLSSVLCALFIIVLGAFTYFKHIHRPDVDSGNQGDFVMPDFTVDNGQNSSTDKEDDFYDKKYTLNTSNYSFLVLGCDRAAWLTDVLMIATYDVKEQSVAIMQIPRDTYVTVNNKIIFDDEGRISSENFDGINDYGCKINEALNHGGKLALKELTRIANLAKKEDADLASILDDTYLDIDSQTLTAYINGTNREKLDIEYDIRFDFGIRYLSALISYSFGTPIDFYAQVNLDGFVNIVNAIGGVDVYIQEDMDYEDPTQDLYIHLKKGQQHLDGEKAEQFVRFRYGYITADIARIDAQKIFMTAFIKKVLSLDGIMNIDSLIGEIGNNLRTNINFSDAMYFATNALGIDMSKIVMLTMPGKSMYIDNISYYSIHVDTLVEYVNTYLNQYNEPLDKEHFLATEIATGNDSTPPLTASDIEDDQPDLGFWH